MRIEINKDERWADVDLRDCLDRDGFDSLSYNTIKQVEQELGIECRHVDVDHTARFVVGVVDIIGRECVVAVYQSTWLISNEPPREQWRFAPGHRGCAKGMVYDDRGNGTGFYLSHSPSDIDYAREMWKDAEKDGWDVESVQLAINERTETEFNNWYNEMAARIKVQAEGAAYMRANEEAS